MQRVHIFLNGNPDRPKDPVAPCVVNPYSTALPYVGTNQSNFK